MRQFRFIPAYYEWHLLDEENNILHNMVDPDDYIFDTETADIIAPEYLKWICGEELENADAQYEKGEEYNGILLDDNERLDKEEMKRAADIMFQALTGHYFTDRE